MSKSTNQDTKLYVVLDSRAGTGASGFKTNDMNAVDEDWERMIMEAGTAAECCHSVNQGEYGNNCIVATSKGIIMWDWEKKGQWKVPDNERQLAGIRKRLFSINCELLNLDMTYEEITEFTEETMSDIHQMIKSKDTSGC